MTNYYVSKSGNNSNDGLSLSTAWGTPSFAALQVSAGDTILLNGDTWLNENIIFSKSGAESQPITKKAYSGTPVLDGVDRTNQSNTGIKISSQSYIIIDGLTITNYFQGVYIRESDHINLNNLNVYNILYIGIYFIDVVYSSLKNSDIHDTGWNSVSVQSNINPTHNITIQNNTIHDNPGTSGGAGHALIDLFNYGAIESVADIDILGNTLYNAIYSALFEHGGTILEMFRINIRDNIIYNTKELRVSYLTDSIVKDNYLHDILTYGILSVTPSGNIAYSNNKIVNTAYSQTDIIMSNTAVQTFLQNDISLYKLRNGSANIIDPLNNEFSIRSVNDCKIHLYYTHNTLFSANGANDVVFSSTNSEYSTIGDELVLITTYPMTARPTTGLAYISIDKFDLALNINQILIELTINATNGDNITFTVNELKPGSSYLIKKDGVDLTSINTGSSNNITFSNSIWSTSNKITIEEQSAQSTFSISIECNQPEAAVVVDGNQIQLGSVSIKSANLIEQILESYSKK